MPKGRAAILAVITVLPLAYIVYFMTRFALAFSKPIATASGADMVQVVLPLHFLTMLTMAGLMVFYIANLFRTDRVPPDKKTLWLIVLLFGNVLAMLVYWYLHIWSAPPREDSQGNPAQ